MKKYRVAYIGMGHIHLINLSHDFSRHPDMYELVGVAEIPSQMHNREMHTKLNKPTDVELEIWDDYKELLAADIDIAVICTDISKTRDCPLARVMRKELRHRGINHLEVICSTEQPLTPLQTAQAETPETDTRPGSTARRDTPGSLPFVPAAAGLAMASVIVRRLAELEA